MSYQFGMNWPAYSDKVRTVIGPPLADNGHSALSGKVRRSRRLLLQVCAVRDAPTPSIPKPLTPQVQTSARSFFGEPEKYKESDNKSEDADTNNTAQGDLMPADTLFEISENISELVRDIGIFVSHPLGAIPLQQSRQRSSLYGCRHRSGSVSRLSNGVQTGPLIGVEEGPALRIRCCLFEESLALRAAEGGRIPTGGARSAR